jgi:hypothetical protein
VASHEASSTISRDDAIRSARSRHTLTGRLDEYDSREETDVNDRVLDGDAEAKEATASRASTMTTIIDLHFGGGGLRWGGKVLVLATSRRDEKCTNTIQLKKLGKELILPRPFSPENGVL